MNPHALPYLEKGGDRHVESTGVVVGRIFSWDGRETGSRPGMVCFAARCERCRREVEADVARAALAGGSRMAEIAREALLGQLEREGCPHIAMWREAEARLKENSDA